MADPTSIVALSISGITAASQVVQYFLTRSSDAHNRQFEAYHRLIKELVQPAENGFTYIDRQCAALFELRRFKRYREVTLRILGGLQSEWANGSYQPRLLRELELTIEFLTDSR